MMQRHALKSLALCIGAALAASASGTAPAADPDRNPFLASALPSGYALHAHADGKAKGRTGDKAQNADACSEGRCGEGMCGEGRCGEGKCGQGKCKKEDKDKDGKSEEQEDRGKK